MGDWFTLRIPAGRELREPGVYLWTIGVDTYVGKAANLESRLREYLRNVWRIENGEPYRRGNPHGFRAVHVALATAKAEGSPIEWQVLEFCELAARLDCERKWIATMKPTLNGPRRNHGQRR
jgi:hypothetical protein